MDLFQLECFCQLAESLNFTQTASALYITQPALSRTIASLENEIGTQLLERNKRAVKLTPAGEAFARECPLIIDTFQRGVTSAKEAAAGKRGTICIGLQRDLFEKFTVDLLNSFRKKYPDIGFDIRLLGINEMIKELGVTLDTAVTSGMQGNGDFGRLLLSDRHNCAVLPPDHPLAARASIRMEELKNERFITMSRYSSNYGHDIVLHSSMDANFEPNIVAEVEFVPGLMMLIACGKGISILHRDLEKMADGRLVFVPLEDEKRFQRYLFWNKTSPNPCLPLFVEFAEQWVKDNNIYE